MMSEEKSLPLLIAPADAPPGTIRATYMPLLIRAKPVPTALDTAVE